VQSKPRILFIDIETAPHTGYFWALFKQNIALSQIKETGRTLCLAWRWMGSGKGTGYVSELDGREAMLTKAHELLSEADIVVTYNGDKFDVPTLNKEFIETGRSPPAPHKSVDLYKTAKRKFRFASNKMDHLAKRLGLPVKVRHQGFELWVQCMAGEPKAWSKMERYNKRDVVILEKLYERMLPWIVNHPNVTLYQNDAAGTAKPACPNCGSKKVQARGTTITRSVVYKRFHCTSCWTWSRSRLADKSVPGRSPSLVGVGA
jgi:DNA polymerase elongation subunit (family B)